MKALIYGISASLISASGAQGRDSTLSICHALLKNALLLSEIAKRPTFIFGNCKMAKASLRKKNAFSKVVHLIYEIFFHVFAVEYVN